MDALVDMGSELEMEQKIRFVCAIDFGTSMTGWGVYPGKNGAPYIQSQWGGAKTNYKNRTAILYDEKREPKAWGFEAEKQFSKKRPEQKWVLLENFKMRLMEDDAKNPALLASKRKKPVAKVSAPASPLDVVWQEHGFQWSLVRVIGDFLAFVKKEIFLFLFKEHGHFVDVETVRWIVTVPAIWNERMKAMMRQACVNAEIVGDKSWCKEGIHFTFALEPEAAAISLFEPHSGVTIAPDRAFMVVDAGGGTIDITVFKKTQDVFVQLHKSSGGAAGGNFVDQRFRQWLYNICQPYIRHMSTEEFAENATDFHRLVWAWEGLKREGEYEDKNDLLTGKFVDWLRQNLDPGRAVVPPNCEGVLPHFDATDTLELTRAQILDFFKPVVAATVDYIRDVLERCPVVQGIVLVGGFSDSPILQAGVRAAFPEFAFMKDFDNTAPMAGLKKLQVPPYPGKAVLVGAVAFGRNPRVVRSRHTRYSYGVRTVVKWKHIGRPSPDGSLTAYGYKELVAINSSVSTESVITHEFGFADYHRLSDAIVHLLCCNSDTTPVLATDSGVSEVGQIKIPKESYLTPDGKEFLQPKISVNLYFGKTSLVWTVTVGAAMVQGAAIEWSHE